MKPAQLAIAFVLASLLSSAEELPLVTTVEFQPLAAQVARVLQAMEMIGEPLPAEDSRQLKQLIEGPASRMSLEAIQRILDKHCLVGVDINPESRVKVQQGTAKAELVEQGWRAFLVKVHNQAGVTAVLAADSPNAGPIPNQPANAARVRWMDLQMLNKQPMKAHLSGLDLEYRILQLYAKESGKREAKIAFDVGQGSQDLGFRNEVDILFALMPSAKITLRVLDWNDKPTTGSFLIRDQRDRVYPSQTKRIAPDFFFHPQVYRADGENVALPPGKYTIEYSRGPEYRTRTQSLTIADNVARTMTFRLERWIDPAKLGWFSGDHHIHAAGCAHYERPTEGVYPQDMMRHVLGEDLKIGSVLTWGPGWYFQKTFFEGKDNALSTNDHRIRYDVEVSGHPSSHTGHLLLLRLKEQDYPGTKRIEDWPSWGLPILRWGKEQGAIVGYTHSGWGLALKEEKLLSYEMPPFDGIGANEFVVAVTHGLADVISAVDTPYPWELNVWYHALNVGYRTRISGETDFPCIYGERVGLGRSYVRQAKLDYDDWVVGLREGRNYASDGRSHLIDFRVNEVEMGSGKDVELAAGGTVKVTAKVAALLNEQPDETIRKLRYDQKPYWSVERARVGTLRKVPVELIVNGRAVQRSEIEADGKLRDVSFQVALQQSSWVALRILPSSHTNPIWVTVGGKPVRSSKRSAQWLREAVDVCFRQKVNRVRLTEQGEMIRAYDHARATYDRLIGESSID
ncbi:MAG: CehA/McbA family metallohydrolase [Bryobacteraceae bacterium]|nr:CehA/McbA family metallohydrolase [Bryobacteraceae bacterium]